MFFLVTGLTTWVIELQEFEDFFFAGLVTNEGIDKGFGLSFTLFLEMTLLSTLKTCSRCSGCELLCGAGSTFLIEVVSLELLSPIMFGGRFFPMGFFRGFFASVFGSLFGDDRR